MCYIVFTLNFIVANFNMEMIIFMETMTIDFDIYHDIIESLAAALDAKDAYT